MRCPDVNCGFETQQDKIKFCPTCGNKLIPDSGPESLVIICNGKLDNGSPCTAELNKSQKFCMNCGKRVDSQLFSTFGENCRECGKTFTENSLFCGECGFKREQLPATPESPKPVSILMTSFKQVKHMRLMYCIANGCTKVASSLVLYYVRLAKPADVSDEEWTLDLFLQRNKNDEMSRRLREEQMNLLFPLWTKHTNINEWDLALLFFVLEICKIDRCIKDDIFHIKKMRNKLYHMGTTEITDTKYSYYKEKIEKYVRNCCKVLNDDSVEKEVTQTFKEVDTYDWDGKSTESLKACFYEWCKHDLILDRLTDLAAGQKVILSRFDNLEKTIITHINKGFSLLLPDPNVGLQIKNCDKKTTEQVSQQVHNHFCDKVSSEEANSPLGRAISEAKHELLAEGRTLMQTSLGCVVLSIRCPTFTSLQSLLISCVYGEKMASWKRVEAILRQQYMCDDLTLDLGITHFEFWRCIEELVKGMTVAVYKEIGLDISPQFGSTIEAHSQDLVTDTEGEDAAVSKIMLTIKPTSNTQVVQIWDEIRSGRFDEKLGNVSKLMAEMYDLTELSITAYMEDNDEFEDLFYPTRRTHAGVSGDNHESGTTDAGVRISTYPVVKELRIMDNSEENPHPEAEGFVTELPPCDLNRDLPITVNVNQIQRHVSDHHSHQNEEIQKGCDTSDENGGLNEETLDRNIETAENTGTVLNTDTTKTPVDEGNRKKENLNKIPAVKFSALSVEDNCHVPMDEDNSEDDYKSLDSDNGVLPENKEHDSTYEGNNSSKNEIGQNATPTSSHEYISENDETTRTIEPDKNNSKDTDKDLATDNDTYITPGTTTTLPISTKEVSEVDTTLRSTDFYTDNTKDIKRDSTTKPDSIDTATHSHGQGGTEVVSTTSVNDAMLSDDDDADSTDSVDDTDKDTTVGAGADGTSQSSKKRKKKKKKSQKQRKRERKQKEENEDEKESSSLLGKVFGAAKSWLKGNDDTHDDSLSHKDKMENTYHKPESLFENNKSRNKNTKLDNANLNRLTAEIKDTHERQKDNQKNEGLQEKDGKNKGKPKESVGSTRINTEEKCIQVHFHVLVSKEMAFKPATHKLILRMGDDTNGWNSNSREMTLVRKIDQTDYVEMEYSTHIPSLKITNNRQIEYKYLVNKPEKEDNKSYIWEHYVKQRATGKNANRTLKIPDQWKNVDEWHQYDGFIEKKQGNWVSDFFTSDKKARIQHATFATQYFCRNIMKQTGKESSSLVDIVNDVTIIAKCIRNIYHVDGGCWTIDSDYREQIGGCIFQTLVETDTSMVDVKKESQAETESRVFNLIMAVRISKALEIEVGKVPEKTRHKLIELAFLHSDENKKQCLELTVLENIYPSNKRKQLKESFEYVATSIAKSTNDPTWIFLAPWIHLISETTKPYKCPDVELDHDGHKPVWWGITFIGDEAMKYFKSKTTNWPIPIEEVISKLHPLFEMDYYLPRTLMAALQLKDLQTAIETQKFPTEVCLATLIYQLRTTRPRSLFTYGYGSITTDEKTVFACISSLLQQMKGMKVNEKSYLNEWKMSTHFACQLLSESTNTNRSDGFMLSAQMCAHIFALYDKLVSSEEKPQTRQATEHLDKVKSSTLMVIEWMKTYATGWNLYLEDVLKLWNQLYAPQQMQSERVRDIWNKEISDALTGLLERKVVSTSFDTKNFVQLYCQKIDDFNSCMQDCLSKVAFKAIQKSYNLDYSSFTRQEYCRFGRLLSDMFTKEWRKYISKGDKNEEAQCLIFVLTWPPLIQYLRIYYSDQEKLKVLDDDCQINLIQAVSIIGGRLETILDGTITVGDLQMIDEHEKAYSEMAAIVDSRYKQGFITLAIKTRQKELQAFHEESELIGTLTTLSSHLQNVDLSALDETLKKRTNIANHKVCEFCTPVDIVEVKDTKTFQPTISAFKLPFKVKAILVKLHYCYKSSTFMDAWDRECNARNNDCKTLEGVVEYIWTPVKSRWDDIAGQIEDGTITFQRLEKHIGKMYREDYDKMQKELLCMKVKKDVISKRLDQLKKHRQLGACVNGAKIIIKFQKVFELTGDFQQIKVIAENNENDMRMNAFDENVMKTCEFLKEVTDSKAKSLEIFVNCGQLVSWLKESMKSGLKELKVFVDLAFMSAGDEPINIKRVQCLHSAVTGYAPLIFDLKPEVDYKEFLNICGLVWKELAADHNLPQKLSDTNRQLEWLKDIKKAHGSVEVTSLIQSDAINANGIYTVGRKASKEKEGEAENTADLGRSLKLTVSEIEGKRQQRNYTYENLQDLQSRLMLVAGKAEKGTDSVDRFTSIFDSVIRLSNVNIKLCSAGCVLFKDWTARFLCDRKKPVCAVLEFGQGEGSPTLKAKRNAEEDLVVVIPKIAKFMETCLDNWLAYIKEKRSLYSHLNYFTIDQLVILQKELVKAGTEEQPSIRIYPLLSAVKKNCTPEDLLAAMNAARMEIDGDEDMKSDTEDDAVGDADAPVEDTEDELRQTFIQELIDAGYEESLALKALKHVDPEEIAEGIVWCMNHEQEMDEDDPAQTAKQEEEEPKETQTTSPTFEGWSQSTASIQSLIRSNIEGMKGTKGSSVDSLLSDLQLLWSEFIGSISSNIKDYLNLEHLGMILKHLSDRETSRIFRKLPSSFQEGAPNLIICPSGDVLNTALSLYVLEKDQPLPQPDEILMCTKQTTIDEVDIFWRRAIFSGGKKIHCLVNADFLDFDVSDAAERYLEQYIQETNYAGTQRYRLVVICGSDNEYRSRIVASLDKHRRPALPLNAAQLREYLGNKLQVTKSDSAIKPAAYVDFNKSTVRVVKSWRAGVGKTLYKSRREHDLERLNGNRVKVNTVSIPLQEKVIDLHSVITRLLEFTSEPGTIETRIFHIDVAHEVQDGVDYLLFNLLVLGSLTDKTGYVWRKSPTDLYIIETLPLMILSNNRRKEEVEYVHQMLNILPDMTCRSPQDSLDVYGRVNIPKGYADHDQLFDQRQFESNIFQRPYQYLYRLDQGKDLKDVRPQTAEGTPQLCLQTLLRHCGVEDPSWAELHHFVWFLNTQLRDFEQNSFVGVAAAEDLPGFAQFVLRFLIQMSRDFSTRSLNMSEESPGLRFQAERMEGIEGQEEGEEDGNRALEQYQLRRTWESSPHPYLFFNADHFTFTFLGFYIDRASGNLIDQSTNVVLERGIMQQNLYDSMVRNFVPIQENFDRLPRHEKILKMCNVMGITMPHDPDDTYELTTDNVKKIMAIYMRFRCDIPVIIMGETGCGKTRLVKFMCSLQMPPGVEGKQNMILMKVHGGTTNADIIKKVRDAERIAQKNVEEIGRHMYTVLFFDEANTTESIGLIKEIMCDKSMEGQKLKLCENLKMVAACNPYRKHSEELIKKLEQAGLGYHVDADNTMDKLGRVPMRRLVYRVQPLPQSLLPLVWDFGQLNTEVEDLYIRQMVKRYIRDDRLPNIPNLIETVSAILTASQAYMRDQRDECSFVSLRDVDRVLCVMSWFYEQSQDQRTLFNKMDDLLDEDNLSDSGEEDEEAMETLQATYRGIDDVTRSLVLSLGVCYHACLKTRDQYREYIARYFSAPCVLRGGADQIEEEITFCQDVYLENVQLEANIARNMALKENLFMMVVCIELRIPLFLVGKPGSSKSLAKTIVSDAMQGNASREDLFKELKQAQMVSFQCSPLSTPDGIVGTFRQCAQFQKDKDLDTFVSIVVLDEVGLAEDSPRMPLKTLHPLLEDGCQGDEKPQPYMKVAFIGISNWALDPAKMNRGILVQREVPDLEELQNSARGITGKRIKKRIDPLIVPMCESYLKIFERASNNMREFFGLRDFYSLVKMVNAFAEKSKQTPTWFEMLHAIKRNFGGLDEEKVDPVEFFKEKLTKIINIYDQRKENDPDCSAAGLIEACLFERNRAHGESRYLLLLTENYGSLSILQQQIMSRQEDIKPITIFGSSFRSDQEYTQVCRNINKIKVCMETGNTVVLLNLENLYESLYDALNQYYVYFGGEKYVDLGLGTHRVKCPVHEKFRLIVVAEKQTVYDKFPIPLINRLEKHFLTINTMLSPEQQILAQRLEEWAKQFVKQNWLGMPNRNAVNKVGDVFMGYHDDTCASIILQVCEKADADNRDAEQILMEGKSLLLWVATPDAVVRLEKSGLPVEEQKELHHIYFKRQKHDSIVEYLHQKLVVEVQQQLFVQVTTHSKLLATFHKNEISKITNIPVDRIMLLDTLSSFDTEQQFSNKIQQHLQKPDAVEPCLLIIQCDSGDINANLVACARYCVMDEYQKVREELKAPVHVVFIVQLPNIAGGCYTGFQCGVWHSVHIDDLWVEDLNLPAIEDMQNRSVSNLIQDSVKGPVPMETADEEESRNTSEAMEWQSDERENMEGMETQEPVASTSSSGETKGTLDIKDVIIGFETAGKKIGSTQDYPGRKLNVKDLILSCTQSALSMLKDKAENNQRTTERVALVLTLFHGTHLQGYDLFLQGMCSLIASLLKEKEKNVYGPENWLTNEAAKPENIHKAGTFRRSCLLTLELKISPILAGIIAHLDTNQNLDILESYQVPWKQELWLAVLNVPEALQLKYSDLQSPKRQSDLQEVVVITTGCDGHIFKAKMPFSWLIQQQLNEMLRTPMPVEDDNETPTFCERIDFYVGVFDKYPLGKVLAQLTDTEYVEEMAAEYLHDFLCMCYKALSIEEFELISQSLRYKYNQMVEEIRERSLAHLLLCIHEAYKCLAPRLTYFHTMNVVWPECSATIVELKQKKPDHQMFQEEEFTFSTLCLLIEHLEPGKKELDQPDGRSKWLNKVHTFRPVIDKVLRLHREDENIYGAHSYHSVQRARCLWSRVVVVKLFLEHVCTIEAEENITLKYCMSLWKVLGDEANLKELKSLEGIEKILKLCNKKAIAEFLGKQECCCFCEAELEGPPIVLPCKDLFCDQCYQNIVAMGDNCCIKCQKAFPTNWTLERQTEKKLEKTKLKNYQKRCNSFFMDIVSQLCFYDNTPPSDGVMDKLLEYITCTPKGNEQMQRRMITKEMTIFNTGLDPNPVFRSFLLQLLMRTSEQKVMENLEKYLKHAELLLRQTDTANNKGFIDLGLLVIQCLEDILTQEMSPSVEIEQGTKCLRRALQTMFTDDLNVKKLYGLAEARIGLRIAAKAIAGSVQRQTIDTNVRKLIEAAQMLCEEGQSEFPRIYLVKYMCRCYGIDVYQAVCRSEKRYLMWIGMKGREENQRVEIGDRLVLCGDTYTTIRESLTKVILGEDCQHLNETLQELRMSQGHIQVMFPLAVYREITCSLLYPQQQRKVTDKEVALLQNYIQDSKDIKDKTWVLKCLQNTLGEPSCQHLTVREGSDFRLQGIQCLLTHFLLVISQLEGDRTVLHPLVGLFKSPQTYVNTYLPTMPQDDLEDVKEALLAARDGNENPVFYRCPNGHPYVIGNCGRPYVVEKCKCGAEIGGRSHNLLPTNQKDAGNDETQTGHILGRAETRGQGPRPEREMSPLYCACVRLSTHMAMYLGTINNVQAIQAMIVPAIQVNVVPEYLWRHIQADLEDLQRGLGRSPDDTFVILHAMVDNMMKKHNKGHHIREEACKLQSKKGRKDWESMMCTQYLQPILKESDKLLQEGNKRIVQDQRLGADPLLCLLYEIDSQQEEENPNHIENIASVWRYRSPITLEHLRQEFEAKKLATSRRDKQLKVLDLFLKEEHYLRAIRCIPSILRLQRELFNKYQRKLDKAEASQITVGHIITDKIAGEDTQQLVEDFIIAWDMCRGSLKQYLCPTDLGGMPVLKDYCQEKVTEDTPIAFLLPAVKDEGLCSYALLDLLMRKQNDFLDKYVNETTKSKKRSPDHMTTVKPMDVTSAHLISYDPQQDLLPLILANCQYSFEIGKGTKIEYDFTSLERQIMDRFLFSKSKIDVGPVLQIDLMVYRAEFTNGEVFKKLEEKIPQDSLSSAVRTQICAEMRTLPDLCQSLYSLDITISFLKSIGGDPNENLHHFMLETLKMKQTILSQKARQSCLFKHIQSLWLLLSLEKSKKMAEHKRPIENLFDSVSQEFEENLPQDIENEFREFMKAISVDKLAEVVAILHEYILLRIAVRQNRNDEDYTDTTNYKLKDWLPAYSEEQERADTVMKILTGFPETLLYKHSVHAWITAYSMLCEKQTGDRRF